MRLALALLAGAGVAALGALVLGEYQFTGWTPYVAGLLFGLVVAEVVVSLARRRGTVVAVPAAVWAAAGMVWAAWISSGRDWAYVPSAAWAGAGLASAGAAFWAGRRSRTLSR